MQCFDKKKSLHESCRMGRPIVVMKLICSLGRCECDDHTLHKLSQRRLTADWLAPLESDCSRMRSKVSSDWLSSYIKATRPVLEIFEMARYFPDKPRICRSEYWPLSKEDENMLHIFYRRILRITYGPNNVNGKRRTRQSDELFRLCDKLDIV